MTRLKGLIGKEKSLSYSLKRGCYTPTEQVDPFLRVIDERENRLNPTTEWPKRTGIPVPAHSQLETGEVALEATT